MELRIIFIIGMLLNKHFTMCHFRVITLKHRINTNQLFWPKMNYKTDCADNLVLR